MVRKLFCCPQVASARATSIALLLVAVATAINVVVAAAAVASNIRHDGRWESACARKFDLVVAAADCDERLARARRSSSLRSFGIGARARARAPARSLAFTNRVFSLRIFAGAISKLRKSTLQVFADAL